MIRSFAVLAMALGLSTSAFAVDQAYYQITKKTVKEVVDTSADREFSAKVSVMGDCGAGHNLKAVRTGDTSDPTNPINALEVVVDQIINIGKKIFAVIDAGKPQVDIRMDSANALPKGLTCWSDMTGWQVPQSKSYNVQYENAYGMTVVDFTYRVVFTAGGSVDGTGQYITNATFMPADLHVAWGYKFSANAQIPSVYNMGTRQAPIAGMQMNLAWKVDTIVTHEEATESFAVSGDNKLIKLQ
jgi:hypothetical protein